MAETPQHVRQRSFCVSLSGTVRAGSNKRYVWRYVYQDVVLLSQSSNHESGAVGTTERGTGRHLCASHRCRRRGRDARQRQGTFFYARIHHSTYVAPHFICTDMYVGTEYVGGSECTEET